MTLITSLPEEVLSMVFNNLDDLNSLAECRLVCKAWSIPAERAMLGSTITISNAVNKTHSLYAVLKKNPQKAYSIKHLDFKYYTDPSQDDCTLDLLQIALAPNVESITGRISADDGFTESLEEIVERSPDKLSKLKTLTLEFFRLEPPFRLLLHCRKTIQTVQLDFVSSDDGINWNFVDKLNEFTNLTSLELAAIIATITDLDIILSKCQQLQKLSLMMFGYESFLDWDQQEIERNANLKELSIQEEEFPNEMLNYLLYKYPSIERAFVNVTIQDVSFNEEDILQPPRLLQRVSQRELIYTISENADIRFILRCLKNNDCQITVEKPDLGNHIRIKVDY